MISRASNFNCYAVTDYYLYAEHVQALYEHVLPPTEANGIQRHLFFPWTSVKAAYSVFNSILFCRNQFFF